MYVKQLTYIQTIVGSFLDGANNNSVADCHCRHDRNMCRRLLLHIGLNYNILYKYVPSSNMCITQNTMTVDYVSIHNKLWYYSIIGKRCIYYSNN